MTQPRAATRDQGLPPHDLYAERAVVGACLVSDKALARLLPELEPTDFYSEEHRVIFSAIRAAARENERIDEVLVAGHLEGSSAKASLFRMIESVPTASNATRYAKVVLDAAKARAALDAADRLKETILNGTPEEYALAPEKGVAELEEIVKRDRSGGAKPLSEGLDELAEWLSEARKNQGVTGVRSGIGKLDLALKGFNPGRFYVLAGRPGSGKSLVSAQIGLTAARQGYRVLLQSPEMRLHEYLKRLATASAGINAESIEAGVFTEEEGKRVFLEGAKTSDLAFFVDDRGTQTVADIRRNVVRYEPDLLIVDYLQRLMPDDRRVSRYEQVSQMSFDLDRIKKDFGIPVLAGAQLSRKLEERRNKRPMLSDLRDSGAIEQDADAVIMLYRPSHYEEDAPENELEFAVEKNRHGPLAQAKLKISQGMWVTDERMV